jgi:hypothetical protein
MSHITPTEFNQEDIYIVLTALDTPQFDFVKINLRLYLSKFLATKNRLVNALSNEIYRQFAIGANIHKLTRILHEELFPKKWILRSILGLSLVQKIAENISFEGIEFPYAFSATGHPKLQVQLPHLAPGQGYAEPL